MSAVEDVWTIERILKVTQDFFAGRGIASPRLDAELLLVEVLKIKRIQLYTSYDRPLKDAERDGYPALVKRRASHEPVAYILGTREFYGRPFAVNRDVLIPRPETEHLVDAVLSWVKGPRVETSHVEAVVTGEPVTEEPVAPAAHEPRLAAPRILDVGTGSGAIAITLAKELPKASVNAVDVSATALTTARANAEALQATVEFLESDLLTAIKGTFDVIVANLPYIGTDERSSLAPDVRDHEPALALFAGADGLDAIKRLITSAVPLLASPGLLALEIGAAQSPQVRELLEKAGYTNVAMHADLAGHPRVMTGER